MKCPHIVSQKVPGRVRFAQPRCGCNSQCRPTSELTRTGHVSLPLQPIQDSHVSLALQPIQEGVPEGEGDIEVENEQLGEESSLKTKAQPLKPSAQEVASHEANGHYPYRSWCRACVGGAGRADAHRTSEEEQNQLPVISMDYGFFTDGQDERLTETQISTAEIPKGATPFLVVKAKPTMMIYSFLVLCKGTEDQVALKETVQSIN